MYKVLIVEDDPVQLQHIKSMVAESMIGDASEIVTLSSSAQLESHVKENHVDIVIMDIVLDDASSKGASSRSASSKDSSSKDSSSKDATLPESFEGLASERLTPTSRVAMDGIDAIAKLSPYLNGAQVIYVTGYPEYCEKAYETDHVSFLLKPVTSPRLNRALGRAVENLKRSSSKLVFSINGSIVALPANRVRYIESKRRKIAVFVEDRCVEAYESLERLNESLPGNFVRTHKGFIANMDFIEELGKSDVRLVTGEVIPLSQRRRADVRERFISHLHGG